MDISGSSLRNSNILIFAAIFFIFALFPYAPAFAAVSEYGMKAAERAAEEEIYNEREWHILMHYKKFPLRPMESLVDDEKFFLSPTGKTDPKSELDATIKALFDPDISKDDDNKHPVCRYSGRREWLIERLNLDRSKLPAKNCSEYDKFLKDIDPASVTLIFPFMYINKPASMFGHTMLRINNGKNDPLTSYSVTFAANTPNDINPFDYIFKGMFGGYYGYYNVKKYSTTIFEYGNIEKRDIWEYDLNFTKEETVRLYNHLWEMQDIGSDYYFFNENCSYNLLLLLESGRPQAELAVSVIWEAPPDTVKLIYEKGFVTDIKYRASHTKILENLSRGLSGKAIKLAQDVALGKRSPADIINSEYSDEKKVAVFDLAIESLRFEFLKKQSLTEEEFARYKEATIALLGERAKIRLRSKNKIKEPDPPNEGHDITRIKLGAGVKNYKEIYTEIGFRTGFHGLDDMDNGYVPNSQLTGFEANLRYNISTGEVTVPSAALISFGSYSPISRMVHAVSYRIDIAGEQKEFTGGKEYWTPYIRSGLGATFNYGAFYFYIMADVDFSFASGYSSFAGIGLGGDAGLSYGFKHAKITASGYYRNYVLGGFGEEIGAAGSVIFRITRNNALELAYSYKNHWKIQSEELSLNWRFYF